MQRFTVVMCLHTQSKPVYSDVEKSSLCRCATLSVSNHFTSIASIVEELWDVKECGMSLHKCRQRHFWC